MSEITNIRQLKTKKAWINWKELDEEVPFDKLLLVIFANDLTGSLAVEMAYRGSKTKMFISVPEGQALDEIGSVTHYALLEMPSGETVDFALTNE